MRWRFYIAMLKHIRYSNTMGPLKNKSGASTQIKTSPFFVSLVRDIIFRNVFWRTKCDPNFGFFLFNKITSSFSYSFHYVLIKWLFVSITYSKYCTYLNQIHDALWPRVLARKSTLIISGWIFSNCPLLYSDESSFL